MIAGSVNQTIAEGIYLVDWELHTNVNCCRAKEDALF